MDGAKGFERGSLREHLKEAIRTAAPELPATNVREQPMLLLGPRSYLARLYAPSMQHAGVRIVACVDSVREDALPPQYDAEVLTPEAFLAAAPRFRGALAVDFSDLPEESALFRQLCSMAGIRRVDMVETLEELSLPTVYQSPGTMRRVTLERIDEFLRVEEILDDPLSIDTLHAFLMLRITCQRSWLDSVFIGAAEEYFSSVAPGLTFRLRDDEVFCDAGAYIGVTVARFLASCGGKYRAIHAYEPDRGNFTKLQSLSRLGLPNLHLHNAALADRNDTINFQQTGTMGSHLTRGGRGNSTISAVALDDQMDELTFLKMDIEGGEGLAMKGAARLLSRHAPRMAVTTYHYAHDLLEITGNIRAINPAYRFKMRQHAYYYYDSVLYAEAGRKS